MTIIETEQHDDTPTPATSTRRRVGAVLGVMVMVATAGIAWAAWTSDASGDGSVTSTRSIASTISGSGDTALYPGAAKTFLVTVDNPNPYPVRVTAIAAGSSDVVGGCAAGSVTTDALAPAPTTIAPGATGSYTLTARMSTGATDACQARTFTVPLTAQLVSTS